MLIILLQKSLQLLWLFYDVGLDLLGELFHVFDTVFGVGAAKIT